MGKLTTLHIDKTTPGIERDAVDETRDEEADNEYQTHVGRVDFLEEVSPRRLCRSRQLTHCQLWSTTGGLLILRVWTAWSLVVSISRIFSRCGRRERVVGHGDGESELRRVTAFKCLLTPANRVNR